MSEFPNLPFTLREGGETQRSLLSYLKKPDKFAFLQKETQRAVSAIPAPTDGDDFVSYQESLLKLWPDILTDALRRLKEKDTREYDPAKEGLLTFFHAESLGVEELHEILQAFSEFEGLLYGASPDRYRDHILHSFMVWIVGQGILNERLQGEVSTGEDTALRISGEEWQCMWALVALCHDIGYPLGAIEKINRRARETFRKLGLVPSGDLQFVFRPQMLPFHDTIIRLMASKPVDARCNCYLPRPPSEIPLEDTDSSTDSEIRAYVTHLQNKYYLKLIKSFDRLDHGIVSALLMSRSLVYFLESDLSHDAWKSLDAEDCRQFLIRREILRAVASHTCPDIYHLRFDTLSFLLYIVDEMQCWGRPTFEELQNRPKSLGNAEVTLEEFSSDAVHIEIKTSTRNWDRELQEGTSFQISRLHRMLRLAVDTPELADRHLFFRIFNDSGQESYLELKDGGIHKEHKFDLAS